jgi:hypothetical protein
MNIKSEIKTITPSIAKEMIKTNIGHNRTASQSHITHLAQQMRAGQWMLNGAPIIIDESGNVIDGQHRLLAVIKSSCSIQSLIISGVESDSFMTIDTGMKRSPGNIFQISGIKNGTVAASAVSGVINYRRAMNSNGGDGGSLNSYIRGSTQDMVAEYNSNPEVYASAIKAGGKLKKICRPALSSTLYALAVLEGNHLIEDAESFWAKMLDGSNLAKNDPILLFRNRLIDNRNSKAKLNYADQLMIGIKAWNAYISKRPISMLKVASYESCPRII